MNTAKFYNSAGELHKIKVTQCIHSYFTVTGVPCIRLARHQQFSKGFHQRDTHEGRQGYKKFLELKK